jgi:hypothetical protein
MKQHQIKILTFHRGTNYGAFLQAWSLKEYLCQSTKHNVEIFDYQSNEARLAEKKVFLPRWKRDFFNLVRLRRSLKYFKFKYWQWKYFDTAIKPQTDIMTLNADTVVFGSDEIWNITNWYKTIDYNFFGVNLNVEIKKVAYAPSMGSSSIGDFEKNQKIISALRSFSSILVRDHNTKRVLEQLEVKSQIVLDPTFLINWEVILKNRVRPTSKKYILLNINQTEAFYPILSIIKQDKKYTYLCKLKDPADCKYRYKCGSAYINICGGLCLDKIIKSCNYRQRISYIIDEEKN